ncbi:MAG TPA: hypothetical protein VEG44_01700 [Candidatus Acidoferrales bacterium]|nr:hypothetical protein [Candidatus Acidoferrales bacterium]
MNTIQGVFTVGGMSLQDWGHGGLRLRFVPYNGEPDCLSWCDIKVSTVTVPMLLLSINQQKM